MSEFFPTNLEKSPNRELVIHWNDGEIHTLSFRRIRDVCQCATCGDKRIKEPELVKSNELPVLSMADTMPLDIVAMKPVGNYGYNIEFSDGHTTGIYTFDFLRNLGDQDTVHN